MLTWGSVGTADKTARMAYAIDLAPAGALSPMVTFHNLTMDFRV